MFKPRKEIIIWTHDGKHHADECMAIALLKEFDISKKYDTTIIRTRKQPYKCDYTIDVGLEYDEINKKFDHHQSYITRPDGESPYASAGLVLLYLINSNKIDRSIGEYIDTNLILAMDRQDCHGPYDHPHKIIDLCGMVGMFEFDQAIKMCRTVLKKIVDESKKSIDYKIVVKNAKEIIPGVLFLPSPGPWMKLVDKEKIKAVIIDTQDEEFILCSNRYDDGSRMVNLDHQLQGDIIDLLFIHGNGFFAKAFTIKALVELYNRSTEECV